MHFRFVCNKICRLPKKSLGEKSCIPGPFLGVYFCSFSESLEKVKQDQIRSNKINQDQTRSIKRTLGINRHAQFATMGHRSPSSKLRGRAVTRRMASSILLPTTSVWVCSIFTVLPSFSFSFLPPLPPLLCNDPPAIYRQLPPSHCPLRLCLV